MSRRTSRRGFLGASTAALGASALGAGAGRRRKPNLLVLWTDEQRADTMAAYGNRRIHAPNLNRLAEQSFVFRNAYVSQPVCTPSRATVMTGLWPHQCGCTANNIPLPETTPCLPELLGDADYHTAYMGKWHLGDEIFAQHGFRDWVSMEYYTAYYRKGRDRSKKPDYHRWLLDHGYTPDARGDFSRGFAARRPIEHCKPKFLEQRACDFIRRHRDGPWMLYVNFLEPHMPFFGPLDDEHDTDEVELPANFADPLEPNEPLRYRLARESCIAKYGGADKVRQLVRRYWGLVTQVDRSVGAILKTLDDLGLADDTLVVYTSDHGDMMGSHRLVEKCVMYEEAVRVPWLMRVPWLGKPRAIDHPVSQIDLVPTLLELLGSQAGGKLPGHSLVPALKGGKPAEDHVFIQWTPGQGALRQIKGTTLASRADIARVARENTRAVISSDGWKLCLSDRDKSQLFHLAADPGETTNLLDSGKHDDVIARLTERLRKWQASVGDKLTL